MPQRRPRYSLSGQMTPERMEQLNFMIEELYSLVNIAGSHGLIDDSVHNDVREDPEAESVRRGDLISGQVTPQGADRIKWQRLEVGAANTVLRSDGTDPQWDSVQLPDDVEGTLDVPHGGTGVATLTDHAVLLGNGASDIETVSGLGTAGQVLTSNGVGADPTWEDATGGIPGYWSPLTDGDVDEMELISLNGDVIMVFVPV